MEVGTISCKVEDVFVNFILERDWYCVLNKKYFELFGEANYLKNVEVWLKYSKKRINSF